MTTTPIAVLIAASLTAVATGLGALPFFFVPKIERRWLGLPNAAAAGLMLGASQGLITEGLRYGLTRLALGILLGLGFITLTRAVLSRREDLQVGALEQADAVKGILIVAVMTLHSFSEGVGVGVAYGGGEELGTFITLAIAVHNIPEGLAISLVLVPRGTSAWRASLWSVFSSLPQPLMAVPAFLLVAVFQPLLPVGLGFAAGAMIWMVFSELIPEALEQASPNHVGIVVTLALTAMVFFQTAVL